MCSFFRETLALPPDTIRNVKIAYLIGDEIVMLKAQEEWHARPTEELNPLILEPFLPTNWEKSQIF